MPSPAPRAARFPWTSAARFPWTSAARFPWTSPRTARRRVLRAALAAAVPGLLGAPAALAAPPAPAAVTAPSVQRPVAAAAQAGTVRAGGREGRWTRSAALEWVERDAGAPGAHGNVHVGDLHVLREDGTTSGHGRITDWRCDPGEEPDHLPHVPSSSEDGEDGERARIRLPHPLDPEESAPACDLVGERWVEPVSLRLVVDMSRGTATVRGTVAVHHLPADGEPADGPGAEVPVDLTLRNTGRIARTSYAWTWDDGESSVRVTSRGRSAEQASVTGSVGVAVVGDDADDTGIGSFSLDRVSHTSTGG
ncbi:hypothetical protein NUM3379_29330 [Kineococcus sp. NUM-3379]